MLWLYQHIRDNAIFHMALKGLIDTFSR